jgi:Uma2 family endonuclease
MARHDGELDMSTQALVEMVQERPDVAWEAAPLLPLQGHWNEEEYLWLATRTNKLVELAKGYLEVLPMPSPKHQKIVLFLYRILFRFVEAHSLGSLLVAPVSVRLWPGQFREPDLVFMLAEHLDREEEHHWNGADLTIEVISPSNPDHDLETKRKEYAQAGITEYWIVNPNSESITVLQLEDDHYIVHGEFRRGENVTSHLLSEFVVQVDAVLDAK